MDTKRGTLLAAILGSGIVSLDVSVVTVALPRIGQQLPRSLVGVFEGQSYVYNGYSLTLSALLILAGAMNDYYGRRRMFAIGLAAFGAASMLSGLAPTLELLIFFRMLQGAAGAFLVPGSLALITATFAGEEQGRAFGVWAAASAAISTVGPFIGGLIVDTVSWRVIFLINIPLVALALWVLWRWVPESRDENAQGTFDVLGAVLAALAVGGLAFGAIYGQQRDWRDPLAFVALGVGCVAAILFVVDILRSSHPLVPPELFRSRNFTVINLSTFVIYGALAVTFYYLTLFLQGTLGYSAEAVGLAFIPGVLFMILFSSRFGALASRYGPRWFLAVGPAIMAVGVLMLTRVPAGSPAWMLRLDVPATLLPPGSYVSDILPGLLIFGIGIMVMVAPLTAALMASIPVRNAGVASAINNAISEVGPQLVGALVFVVITGAFYAQMAARVPGLDTSSPAVRLQIAPLNPVTPGAPAPLVAAVRAASTNAFHLAMLVSVALLLLGAIINAAGVENTVSAKGHDVVSSQPTWRRWLCRATARMRRIDGHRAPAAHGPSP